MINNQNANQTGNQTISNVKEGTFVSCGFETKVSNGGTEYSAFEFVCDNSPKDDYSIKILVFPPRLNEVSAEGNTKDDQKAIYLNNIKIGNFCRNLDQFGIAAIGDEAYKTKKTAFLEKNRTEQEYAQFVAAIVNGALKPGAAIEFFRCYVVREGKQDDGGYKYYKFDKTTNAVTHNGNTVNPSEVEFESEKDGKIYLSIPKDVDYTGRILRKKGEKFEFVESAKAKAFREIAARKLETPVTPAATETTSTDDGWF
jgi:hypothetical protein